MRVHSEGMSVEAFFSERERARSRNSKRDLSRLLIFTILAAIALVGLASPLSFANHGTRTMEASPEVQGPGVDTSVLVTATLSSAASPAAPVYIDFEIETGPNNPDGNSPSSPDATCTIFNPAAACGVLFSSTQTGQNLIRIWVDHDNNDATLNETDGTEGRTATLPFPAGTDCTSAESTAGNCASTPVPGGTAEPDTTDVVEINWQPGTPTQVDCEPDVTKSPVTGTSSPPKSFICSVKDSLGNGVPTRRVDGENLAGVNDPDDNDFGPSNNSPDYNESMVTAYCTTGPGGTCTANVAPNEGQAGSANICFWGDTDNDSQYAPGTTDQFDGGDCDVESQGDTDTDLTDVVNITWESPAPSGLDAVPDHAARQPGQTATVTATIYDQFGSPFNSVSTVSMEFFSGAPNDLDGNTPESADRSCSTAGGPSCVISWQSANNGDDLACLWFGSVPTMTGDNVGGTCNDEPLADQSGNDGPPSPGNDNIDVINSDWDPPPYFPGDDRARDLEYVQGSTSAGYILDGYGNVWAFGGASVVTGTPVFGSDDVAEDLELFPGGGGWILDAFGGIHRFGAAPVITTTGYWDGFDIARDLEFLGTTFSAGYKLDGFGGVHPFGGAATATGLPYFSGFDIARDLDLRSAGGGYILDGWGGVHPFSGAPTATGLPYFAGFDIARDMEQRAAGGGYVLDGWGGVHRFSGAPTPTAGTLPYFPGFDIARDLELFTNGGTLMDGYAGRHNFATP